MIIKRLSNYPLYDFDLRATHARTLLPEALATVSFGFVLARVRVNKKKEFVVPFPWGGLHRGFKEGFIQKIWINRVLLGVLNPKIGFIRFGFYYATITTNIGPKRPQKKLPCSAGLRFFKSRSTMKRSPLMRRSRQPPWGNTGAQTSHPKITLSRSSPNLEHQYWTFPCLPSVPPTCSEERRQLEP